MTSLVAWFGSDQRGPASAYIATDSRISWESRGVWDCGKKVFACSKYPEIFGYVGDVVYPFISINQLTSAIDNDLIFSANDGPLEKVEAVKAQLHATFSSYPMPARLDWKIAYFTRLRSGMESEFHFFEIGIDGTGAIDMQHIPIGQDRASDTVVIWGSGEKMVKDYLGRWKKSSQGGTSRAVFSALCDSINAGRDRHSGGPPQIAGLYRTSAARTLGFSCETGSYFEGLPLLATHRVGQMEWRDRLFQRCDRSGRLLKGAQRHGRPKEVAPDSGWR